MSKSVNLDFQNANSQDKTKATRALTALQETVTSLIFTRHVFQMASECLSAGPRLLLLLKCQAHAPKTISLSSLRAAEKKKAAFDKIRAYSQLN